MPATRSTRSQTAGLQEPQKSLKAILRFLPERRIDEDDDSYHPSPAPVQADDLQALRNALKSAPKEALRLLGQPILVMSRPQLLQLCSEARVKALELQMATSKDDCDAAVKALFREQLGPRCEKFRSGQRRFFPVAPILRALFYPHFFQVMVEEGISLAPLYALLGIETGAAVTELPRAAVAHIAAICTQLGSINLSYTEHCESGNDIVWDRHYAAIEIRSPDEFKVAATSIAWALQFWSRSAEKHFFSPDMRISPICPTVFLSQLYPTIWPRLLHREHPHGIDPGGLAKIFLSFGALDPDAMDDKCTQAVLELLIYHPAAHWRLRRTPMRWHDVHLHLVKTALELPTVRAHALTYRSANASGATLFQTLLMGQEWEAAELMINAFSLDAVMKDCWVPAAADATLPFTPGFLVNIICTYPALVRLSSSSTSPTNLWAALLTHPDTGPHLDSLLKPAPIPNAVFQFRKPSAIAARILPGWREGRQAHLSAFPITMAAFRRLLPVQPSHADVEMAQVEGEHLVRCQFLIPLITQVLGPKFGDLTMVTACAQWSDRARFLPPKHPQWSRYRPYPLPRWKGGEGVGDDDEDSDDGVESESDGEFTAEYRYFDCEDEDDEGDVGEDSDMEQDGSDDEDDHDGSDEDAEDDESNPETAPVAKPTPKPEIGDFIGWHFEDEDPPIVPVHLAHWFEDHFAIPPLHLGSLFGWDPLITELIELIIDQI